MDPLPPTFRAETRAAIEAVRVGLALVLVRHAAEDVRIKGPGDLVTGTDLVIQARVEARLHERFAAIPFVGEEGQPSLPSHGSYWLVDPLCGTSNYAAGLSLCAVNVALVNQNEVTLAVIGDGNIGHVYVAERRGGAWRLTNGGADRVRVSDASGLISIDPRGGGPGALRTFGREFATYLPSLLDGGWDVRMLGTSLVLAYLAAGSLAGAVYAQDGLPVHFLAGLLLAHEAGATVTDQTGKGWTLHGPVFVAAATATLHAELLAKAQAAVRTCG